MSSSEKFKSAKRAAMGQLLLKCARLLNEEAVNRIRKSGQYPQLRTIHLSLLPHLDIAGTRLTELSKRLGVSKQAAAQLVEEMCDFNILEKVPDPTDGRAKLLRVKGGEQAMMQGLKVLLTLEEELDVVIGSKRMLEFHDTLLEFLRHMETEHFGI
ncbi:MAG: MarR family transcriptional regulator [Deltaproteobacteria bacterium]|nr:MarR family transcriptional regulator [Deltaproteobacteria bacterium]